MTSPLLWVCGPPGIGKSTIAYEIFVSVHRAGVRAAYVDCDQVGMCYPAPPDDPHNHRLKAANVAAVWEQFRIAGAQCLIISGGVRFEADVRRYLDQLADLAPAICRLRASDDELQARLALRGAGYGPPVPGRERWRVEPASVEQALSEARALDDTTFADLTLDTGGLGPAEAAARVRHDLGGWPAVVNSP